MTYLRADATADLGDVVRLMDVAGSILTRVIMNTPMHHRSPQYDVVVSTMHDRVAAVATQSRIAQTYLDTRHGRTES